MRCRTKGIGQGFSMALWLAAAATLFALPLSRAFYLPGVAPHEYKDGESVRQLHTYFGGALLSPTPIRAGVRLTLRCRHADLSESQQAVFNEDVAALRVLPPAVLQARRGVLLELASPDRRRSLAWLALDRASDWATVGTVSYGSSLTDPCTACRRAGGKFCREPGRNPAGRSHRIVSLSAADEARRVLQGAVPFARVQ